MSRDRFEIEGEAHQDAQWNAMSMRLDLEVVFGDKAFYMDRFISVLEHIEHRLVAIEARVAQIEAGAPSDQRHLNFGDVIRIATGMAGTTPEAVRDPKPRAEPAILIRQFIIYFGVRRLNLRVEEVAKWMGGTSAYNVNSALRAFDLRQPIGRRDAKIEQIESALIEAVA